LVVHPSIPAHNLRDFIALARSKPAQFNYSSSGTGNLNHLAGELFNMMAKVKLVHIPYKGGGPAIVDVLGGQVAATFQVPISVMPHIASGRLKPMAITGETRLATLPQIPTFAESGLPGYELSGWTGILVPAGTPQAVIDRISSEMGRILALPEIADSLVKQGMEPFASTPAQFAAKIDADIAKFGAVIKAASIKLD
jgi:tripartite-type tricarboxylate transporter receptor subunit TctC